MLSKHSILLLLVSFLTLVNSTAISTTNRRAINGINTVLTQSTISNKTFPARPHVLPPYDPHRPKRGVSFTNPAWLKPFDKAGSRLVWSYNWDSAVSDGMPNGIEYMPMLWGTSDAQLKNWKVNTQNAINRGANFVLGFNEPDVCGSGSSCLTPKAAADAWRTYIQPFASQAYLGSPAITAGGIEWLKSFLQECSDCHIDFVTVHWYDNQWAWQWFEDYMKSIKAVIGNRNIWVTEFNAGAFTSPKATEDEQITFLKNVIPWMDTTDWIERYAWFMAAPEFDGGSITDANGNPTKLGQYYAFS